MGYSSKRFVPGPTQIACALAAVLLTGCGDDAAKPPPANTTVPQAWAGIWSFELVATDCGTGAPMPGYSSIDTLCAGSDISKQLGQLDTWCGGGRYEITPTELRYDCSHNIDTGGCRMSLGVQLTGTLDAAHDQVAGSGQARIDISPEGSVCGQSECATLTLIANRIAPEPASCGSR